MDNIRVLLIGQLPKEIGGNYTTGIAKVVYFLSRQKVDGLDYYVYATNAQGKKIRKIDKHVTFLGYEYLIGRMLKNILLHPLRTFNEWKVYRKSSGVNPIRYEFYKANFQKVLNRTKPNIIHMNGCGIEPLYFANQEKIPIVLTCHGVFQRNVNPQSAARLYANYVTGLTDETKDEIIKYFCVDEKKITIIPNGVDTKRFYFSETERIRIRQEYGVPEDTIVFITVASVQERKGQLRFSQILKDYPNQNWEYWIVGKGPDEEAIRRYCEEQRISHKVKLLGYKNGDELYKYYSAADVYAHASTMEGQALCEIEAFSTGLKILVNEKIIGTIAKEELEIGDYLIMNFNTPDYHRMKEWLNKAEGARESFSKMDWHRVALKYFDLYSQILRYQSDKE